MPTHRRASPAFPRLLACSLLALIIAVVADQQANAAGGPSASGARLVAATMLDRDADGKVDSVRLRYSQPVRLVGKNIRVNAAGRRVRAGTGAGRAPRLATQVVFLVDEGRSPDTGVRFAVTYHPMRDSRLVDRRGLVVRSGRVVASDGAAPVLVGARTADGDADGVLDGVRVRFSEPVRTAGRGGSPFDVDGAAAGAADAQALKNELSVAIPTSGADTSARPTVTYVPGARTRTVVDGTGRRATRARVTPDDGAKPVLRSARTLDRDGNGRTDAVEVELSEGVDPARLQVAGRDIERRTAEGNRALLVVSERPEPDTATRPEIAPGGTADAAGNRMDGTLRVADGAPPVLLEARTDDSDGDGQIARVGARFSEPVHGSSGGLSVGGRPLEGPHQGTPRDYLELALPQPIDGTDARPVISVARGLNDAGGHAVRDGAVKAADAARPRLLGVVTDDANTDGKVDGLRLSFSEPVDMAATPPKVSAGRITALRRGSSETHVLADLVPSAPEVDSGLRPTVTLLARESAFVDRTGLLAVDANIRAADAVSPVMLDARTVDQDGDGQVDAVSARFSEPVVGSLSGTSVRGRPVQGGNLVDATQVVDMPLEQPLVGTDARPTVDLRQGLSDAAGNPARVGSMTAADGSRPQLLDAETVDANGDARLDGLRLRFSEPVDVTSSSPAGVVATGGQVDALRALPDQTEIAADFTPTDSSADTALRPTVSVSGSAQLVDQGGLTPATVSARARDSAPPVLVDARFADPVDRGTVVAVWSESVEPDTASGRSPFAVVNAADAPVPVVAERQSTTAREWQVDVDATVGLAAKLGYDPAVDTSLIRDAAGNRARPTATPVPVSTGSRPIAGSVLNPVAPAFQVPWGQRSHYVQPWRAYMDTVPATTLLDSVGINLNIRPEEADHAARMLAANGMRRARIEIGWGVLDYDDPTVIKGYTRTALMLTALKKYGIRPLILLNSHHSIPCPAKAIQAQLTAAATAGDRTIQVDSATAAKVVPGRSGLNSPDSQNRAAHIMFTAVDLATGTVTLSKPLPKDFAAGSYKASLLRYGPFQPPTLPDGSANPEFLDTVGGWADYADVVTRKVAATLGTDDFDVEVWNEQSFGANFLDSSNYYTPRIAGSGNGYAEILKATVDRLRDPATGLPNLRISSGFSNQRPSDAGSTSPVGLNALGKHPYRGVRKFPGDQVFDPGTVALDGLNKPSFDAVGPWPPLRVDKFVPTYRSFLPEYYLTAIQTEHMVRDISPYDSKIGPVVHGRNTAPPGGNPLGLWITEFNMDFSGADPSDPANVGAGPIAYLTSADKAHLQAKAVLRTLSAYVNKGVSQVDFYGAQGSLSLVNPAFYTASANGTAAYPGDRAGGVTMDALHRFTDGFAGAAQLGARRSLSLRRIDDFEGNKQFDGNGTPGYPPLYNRDVLAFLPFQVTASRFVVPVYVMTRDIAELYHPELPAGDPTRYDMPQERYRLTIGGVDGTTAQASATDPLSGTNVPVQIVNRGTDEIQVELPVTDSPRLLAIDD